MQGDKVANSASSPDLPPLPPRAPVPLPVNQKREKKVASPPGLQRNLSVASSFTEAFRHFSLSSLFKSSNSAFPRISANSVSTGHSNPERHFDDNDGYSAYHRTERLKVFPPANVAHASKNEDQLLANYMTSSAAQQNAEIGLPVPKSPKDSNSRGNSLPGSDALTVSQRGSSYSADSQTREPRTFHERDINPELESKFYKGLKVDSTKKSRKRAAGLLEKLTRWFRFTSQRSPPENMERTKWHIFDSASYAQPVLKESNAAVKNGARKNKLALFGLVFMLACVIVALIVIFLGTGYESKDDRQQGTNSPSSDNRISKVPTLPPTQLPTPPPTPLPTPPPTPLPTPPPTPLPTPPPTPLPTLTLSFSPTPFTSSISIEEALDICKSKIPKNDGRYGFCSDEHHMVGCALGTDGVEVRIAEGGNSTNFAFDCLEGLLCDCGINVLVEDSAYCLKTDKKCEPIQANLTF